MHRHARYTASDIILHGFAPRLLAQAEVLECWVIDVGDPEDWTTWNL